MNESDLNTHIAICDELVLKKNDPAECGEKWVPPQEEIDAILGPH
jgi:hypothetical protein